MSERVDRGGNVGRRRTLAAGAAVLAAAGALAAGCAKTQAVSNGNPVAEKVFKLDCKDTETQLKSGGVRFELGYPRKLVLLDPEVANGQHSPTFWGAEVEVSLGTIVKDKNGRVISKETETETLDTWVSVHNGGGESRLFYGVGNGTFPTTDALRKTNMPFVRDQDGHIMHKVGAYFSGGWREAEWHMAPVESKPQEINPNKISTASIECFDSLGEPTTANTRTTVGVPLLAPPAAPNDKDLPPPGE